MARACIFLHFSTTQAIFMCSCDDINRCLLWFELIHVCALNKMAEKPILVNIELEENGSKSSVHSKVERVSVNETFRDVFNSATNDVNVSKLDVFASPNLSRNGEVSVDCDEPISFIDQLFSDEINVHARYEIGPGGRHPDRRQRRPSKCV